MWETLSSSLTRVDSRFFRGTEITAALSSSSDPGHWHPRGHIPDGGLGFDIAMRPGHRQAT